MYEYACTITRVVDGDTQHVNVDLGCDVHIDLTLRLLGIDCPEMNTDEGVAAKEFAIAWFEDHDTNFGVFTLQTVKDHREKYGRYLATLVADDGTTLNQALLDAGLAVPYDPR